jgi:uncharacterized membrane protein YkoI
MKRKFVIATMAAAVLVGGGTYTAAALSGETAAPAPAPVAVSLQDRDDDGGDTRDDRDDDGGRDGSDDNGDRTEAPKGRVTAAQAAAAALARTPGTVDSVDIDDDGDGHWEVEVLGRDDRVHDIRVDARTGAAEAADTDEDPDDADDRAALRGARVDAGEAAAAALKSRPGSTVTSIESGDDDSGRWEVELRDGKGAEHEVTVDARTAAVKADDDGNDDD